MTNLNAPEPAPQHNNKIPIWNLVIADMKERDNEGRKKYGTPLQAGNGRDPLIDAYQESLDQVVYLRQEIEERQIRKERDERYPNWDRTAASVFLYFDTYDNPHAHLDSLGAGPRVLASLLRRLLQELQGGIDSLG